MNRDRNKIKINLLLIGTFIISILISSLILIEIFEIEDLIIQLSIGVLASILAAGIWWLLKTLRINILPTELNYRSRKDTFDVFLFGHSASGKTTFIQKLISMGNSAIPSTEHFNYYSRKKFALDIDGPHIDVNIADYRGQKIDQIVHEAQNTPFINALILFVDIAPSYDDKNKLKLSEGEIIKLMSNDWEEQLNNRLKEHNEYLSISTLQVIFGAAACGDHLTSVRLLINKFDILETLQQEGKIEKEVDLKGYVKKMFQERIRYIEKFCDANDIKDFKFEILSAKNRDAVAKIFEELGKNFHSTRKK